VSRLRDVVVTVVVVGRWIVIVVARCCWVLVLLRCYRYHRHRYRLVVLVVAGRMT